MNKVGLITAGVLAALIFAYGSIAAMVNQGMSLPAAIVIFIVVIVGGIAVVRFLGDSNDPPENPPS